MGLKTKIMKIRFYERDCRWYADLPEYIAQGGTEEECEMVAGADTWLEMLSKGKSNITLEISELPIEGSSTHLLKVDGEGNYREFDSNHEMWLCSVTVYVFGHYPDKIYYNI